MDRVHIRDVFPSDCAGMAHDMRAADFLEVSAMAGLADDPSRMAQHLWDGVVASPAGARVAFHDGRLACMWGVTCPTLLGHSGHPWMVGTDKMTDPAFTRVFARCCKAQFEASIPAHLTSLWNLVHADNRVAIRWLRYMGFRFDPVQIPHRGLMWLKFSMEAS